MKQQALFCLSDNHNPLKPLSCYEVKGSKFISYLCAINHLDNEENAEALLHTFKEYKQQIFYSLKQEHKKARHFVEAFRICNPYQHIVEGNSDDGEPKGSSGVPILEVLRGEQLINVLCVCVRYFGGIKLGIGGLVRAYTQSVLEAIMELKKQDLILLYKQNISMQIQCRTSESKRIHYLSFKYHLMITQQFFLQESMQTTLKGTKEDMDKFLWDLSRQIQVKII